jgi:hypothetical protein
MDKGLLFDLGVLQTIDAPYAIDSKSYLHALQDTLCRTKEKGLNLVSRSSKFLEFAGAGDMVRPDYFGADLLDRVI